MLFLKPLPEYKTNKCTARGILSHSLGAVWSTMDSAAAISVLKRVLCHLPTGIWWQLYQRMANALSISKAFDLLIATVDGLLVVAGQKR